MRFVSRAVAAMGFSAAILGAGPSPSQFGKTPGKRVQMENHKDLIAKARNLTLQRDRLQASQVLQRGLRNEAKSSVAHKEMARALEDLSGVFYTEKGQTLFSLAESAVDSRPREAIENYQAALRAEDGNVSILKAMARAHLLVGECEKADTIAKQAQSMNPVSPEIRLLRLQASDCAGNAEALSSLLNATDVDMAAVEKFIKGPQMKDLLRRKDLKKARSLLISWEASSPDYPEVFYWKWKMAAESAGAPDRAAALKYAQLCQDLSPRRKKSSNFDLELCKGKEAVEEYLKGSGLQDAVPSGEEGDE
jgi:tetratricopeptide (TPR) repeat protein